LRLRTKKSEKHQSESGEKKQSLLKATTNTYITCGIHINCHVEDEAPISPVDLPQ
jgi:hypothetical protein